jgi:hypothetical protein
VAGAGDAGAAVAILQRERVETEGIWRKMKNEKITDK